MFHALKVTLFTFLTAIFGVLAFATIITIHSKLHLVFSGWEGWAFLAVSIAISLLALFCLTMMVRVIRDRPDRRFAAR